MDMSELSPNEIRIDLILATQKSHEIAKVKKFLMEATQLFLGVAGELDEKTYNKKFAKIIRKKMMKYPNFKASIIFTKIVDDKEKALKETYKKNKEVCELLKDKAFEGRFSLYWSKNRQNHHFRLADKNITLEKVHDQKMPRDVFVVENSTAISEDYKNKFEEAIKPENEVHKLEWSDFVKNIA
jgi:hypothetical protein